MTEQKVDILPFGFNRGIKQMDNIVDRIDNISEKMDNITNKIDKMIDKIDNISEKMDMIIKIIDRMNKRMDHLDEKKYKWCKFRKYEKLYQPSGYTPMSYATGVLHLSCLRNESLSY